MSLRGSPMLLSRLRAYFHHRRLRRQVLALQGEMRSAAPVQRGLLLDRLADLYRALGREREALASYGGAVDVALGAGRLDTAAALCRKLVSLYPRVVRAHGTLGCLLLARGSFRQAEWELTQYVRAARREGAAGYARDRLRMLVDAFGDPPSRLLLARLLREMGDPTSAREVERSLNPALAPARQRELLAALLRRTVLPQVLAHDAVASDELLTADLPFLDTALPACPPASPPAEGDTGAGEDRDEFLARRTAGPPAARTPPATPLPGTAAAPVAARAAASGAGDADRGVGFFAAALALGRERSPTPESQPG